MTIQRGLFGENKQVGGRKQAPAAQQLDLFSLAASEDWGSKHVAEMENSIPLNLSIQDPRTAEEREADTQRAAQAATPQLTPPVTAIVPVGACCTLKEATFQALINEAMRDEIARLRTNCAEHGHRLLRLVQAHDWIRRGKRLGVYIAIHFNSPHGNPRWFKLQRSGYVTTGHRRDSYELRDDVTIADLATTAIVPVGERRTVREWTGRSSTRPDLYPDPVMPEGTACELCTQPADLMWNDHPICDSCNAQIVAFSDKRERRVERLRAASERAYSESQSTIAHAERMADAIPFGQPILVGHHSEKWDRRYRERIWNTFGKGYQRWGEARELADRAAAAEKNRAISSDDPAAVIKLQEKIEAAEREQAQMKQVNAKVRAALKQPESDRVAWLARETGLKDSTAARLLEPDFAGRVGYPDYLLTNNNANIRRMKQRLEDLKRQAKQRAQATDPAPAVEPIPGIRVVRNLEENRIQILFPGKPDNATRALLKSRGFKWAPSQGAWQRQLNGAGEYAAECVIAELKKRGD